MLRVGQLLSSDKGHLWDEKKQVRRDKGQGDVLFYKIHLSHVVWEGGSFTVVDISSDVTIFTIFWGLFFKEIKLLCHFS